MESVLDQTYQNIEIIVVDDGSNEPKMANALSKCLAVAKGKLQVINQRNAGPGRARRRGLEIAKGEYIQFLDSDDLLFAGKFENQVGALVRDRDAEICYGKTVFIEADGQVIAPWRRTGEEIRTLFPSMLGERWWGTSTPLYRASLIERVGPISDLINEEDWEYDCRLAAEGVLLVNVEEYVSVQRSVATERLSTDGSRDPTKLADRIKARHAILDSALKAGVPITEPEFQRFISYSFLLARQSALAGLTEECRQLIVRLNYLSSSLDKILFIRGGRLFGFRSITRITETCHKLLRKGRSITIL